MKHVLLLSFIAVILLPQGIRAQELMSDCPDESSDAIFDMSIDELMEVDIWTGKPGWFGNQLEQLGFVPYIHGYAVMDYRDHDFNRDRPIDTFNMHYFNIIVGANMGDRLSAEILLEYEHGGDDTGVRYGIIDYEIAEPVILRMGKFLVPMGRFNEFLSPEYANELPDRPYCLWQIVPIVWAETGVQLRGGFDLPSKRSLNYAFYVVNGLEQPANSDGSVGEGGSIRSMRQNNRDSNNSSKAWGGRIGFKPFKELEVGASYYTGAYTIDGNQDLSITDFHVEYDKNKLILRGEYVKANQQTSGADLDKKGFYAEASYRINSFLKPVVRYDQADLDSGTGHDFKRSTIGLVYYPNPKLHPMFNFKISKSIIHDNGYGDREDEFVAQCVIGF